MGSGPDRSIGTVSAFDAAVGTGLVTATDGTEYPFHCIEIADGSRSVPVGVTVEFLRLPRFGRYQAAQLRPV